MARMGEVHGKHLIILLRKPHRPIALVHCTCTGLFVYAFRGENLLWFDKFAGSEFERTSVRPEGRGQESPSTNQERFGTLSRSDDGPNG
ncbi:hypothetical protein TK45_04745 [Bowmanella sp. JS7-9]|nr:hypothetical protein TK45_04745 [Bowmanella sp. JS7-9]